MYTCFRTITPIRQQYTSRVHRVYGLLDRSAPHLALLRSPTPPRRRTGVRRLRNPRRADCPPQSATTVITRLAEILSPRRLAQVAPGDAARRLASEVEVTPDHGRSADFNTPEW